MNQQSIAFIISVNDESLYEECIKYIDSLIIPSGYEIEKIAIREAQSMASAYNQAMEKSNSKYKVYLHQDTFIVNKNFILDCLRVFEEDKEIGMLGVIGAEIIPSTAIWWRSQHLKGKVYQSRFAKMELLDYDNKNEEEYTEVKAIDGLIMITQYDVKWRADVFDGWHFYDISQCVEFNNAGYKVAIPKQENPWCVHDSGVANIENGYHEYRKDFLTTYSKNIFPLVSILIPTYNRPEYLKIALESAINQTYGNIEIIVGDDSNNNETEEIMKQYISKYANIRYFHNEVNLGQFDNDLKLMEMAKGEYINFLMDDDLFELDKIEKMMFYFIDDLEDELSIVSSNRKIIDSIGEKKYNFIEHQYLTEITDKVIKGKEMTELIITCNWNLIGEPTTALFKKNKLTEKFGVYNNRRFICNVDQAAWFNLLKNGDVLILSESLSSFRKHDGQQQEQENIVVGGAEDFIFTILTARENGLFEDNMRYATVIKTAMKQADYVIEKYPENKKGYMLREKIKDELKCEMKSLPLVSILMPTYNQTKYLKEALESAINQTYPNIEIIIGDDSTTNEVEEFVKPYLEKHENIVYFKNERNKMDYGVSNVWSLFERSKGEYINYLYHDDIFHPQKIKKMMKYFLENQNITLVTSVRQPIDDNGNMLALDGAFTRLFDQDTLVSGYEMSRLVINNFTNCIGEPTTVLFKRRYLEGSKFGYINETFFGSNFDMATWITLLQYGDIMYISETLSYFRMHSEQNSSDSKVFINGVIDLYNLINEGYKLGIIQNNNEYKSSLGKWVTNYIGTLMNLLVKHNFATEDLSQLEECYHSAISEIAKNNNHINYECPICGGKLERFLPYQYKEHISDFTHKFDIIGSDTENFLCPHCYCHDRERHLVKYFDKLNIWNKYIVNKNVLHIAPERYVQSIISKLKPKNYICGDLYPVDDSIVKMDITNIQFEDNYFHFIICNHVLEHIPNDLKAMKELYRILDKGGCAVLQTQYSANIDKSFEDTTINTDKLRREFFGQSDHIRVYGKDLFERIKSVGFKLKIVKNNDLFTEGESKKFGFNNKENLILVVKE